MTPIPPLGRDCGECRFADVANRMMICRRYPPTTITLPNGQMGTWHPVVQRGDWCFEFSASLKIPT